MPRTYEDINYSLRPAKCIERKMLCDTFRKLTEFGSIETYRYIGFGSTYFSDFSLFHRQLGITNMISIERDTDNRSRFEFNRPFSCIQIEFGESNEILPSLTWNMKTILWLDYDGKLESNMLTDIAFFCASAISGSLILVTVNVQSTPFKELEEGSDRLTQLKERVGETKIPIDVQAEDLTSQGFGDVCQRIITNEILETLRERNAALPPENKVQYKQLFNFRYSDGSKMLTVGGLLYEEAQSHFAAKCAFENFSFVSLMNNSPYVIEVPNLTYREIRHLDSQLPCAEDVQLRAEAIPERDLKRYKRLYRYFPVFTESEM